MNAQHTIKEAQRELEILQADISEMITNYEQEFGVQFVYTAFVDHAPEGTATIRLTAKL